MRGTLWLLLLAIAGCGSENEIIGPPPRPAVPNPPQQDPTITVDRYRQIAEPKVDVLFVVDNSSSMSEEQAALATNFPLFLSYFQTSGLDYHIGVVATDVQRPRYRGRLRISNGYNFIDKDTLNPDDVFSGMTNGLGVITGSEESGRAAAYMALVTNADHPDNEGFYREEAELHVVFVSDTDDNSGGNPSRPEFMNWASNLKSSGRDVVFHAIVQLPNDANCGLLRPGNDYIYYASQTGGVAGSICESDWTPVLDNLGLQSTGLKQEFFLQRLPQLDAGIDVQVHYPNEAGQTIRLVFDVCLAGDEIDHPDCDVAYNPGRNSVVFLDFIAQPLAEVFVTYTRREDFTVVTEEANSD